MYKLCHKCRLPYQEYKGTACNCMSKTYINEIPDTTEGEVIKSIQQACISDITRCIAQQRSMSYTVDTIKQYLALFPHAHESAWIETLNRETKNEKLLRVLVYFFQTTKVNGGLLADNEAINLGSELTNTLTKYFTF